MNPPPWTPAEDAEATRRWVAGESAAAIARAMDRKLSRNAVLGRLHRLGAIRPDQAKARLASGSLQRKIKAAPKPRVKGARVVGYNGIGPAPDIPMPKLRAVAPQCEPATLLERTGCPYPLNDGEGPRGWLFCNAVRAGPTYCADHARLCFMPPEKRKARAA